MDIELLPQLLYNHQEEPISPLTSAKTVFLDDGRALDDVINLIEVAIKNLES